MKRRIAGLAGVVLALALPAATQAALPKKGGNLIVPSKSIGGFALGGSPAALVKAWGGRKCEFVCSYEGKKLGETATALFETKGKGAAEKAWTIYVATGVRVAGARSIPNCGTPLTRYETSKGIHLCSTVAELTKAYPSIKELASIAYELKGPGKSRTEFLIGEGNRIIEISVQAHPGG